MLLCDVASLIRLSIRFVFPTLPQEHRVVSKPLRQLRLDYNIAPRAASTEGWGDAGTW